MTSASDDDEMMKLVQATHATDGPLHEFAVKPLLCIIEDIFQPAIPAVPGFGVGTQAQLGVLDDKAFQSDFLDMIEPLSFTINEISNEISSKFSVGEDELATTFEIFKILAKYAWDAKVVLALAAFAFNFGEFWVVSQPYSTSPLARSVPLLKQFPETLESVDTLKPKIEALSNLIKATMDVTKCIIEFKALPSQYSGLDTPEMMFPTAAYWSIRSIVAGASQIMRLLGMGYENISSTINALKLSSLTQKVSSIHNHFERFQPVDERSHIEAYKKLVGIMQTQHKDYKEVLRALIYPKDDQLPLLDSVNKRRVNIDVIKRKFVVLLISDLDVSPEELFVLQQIYQESRDHPSKAESQYEVVWLPMVDRSSPWTLKAKQDQFENLQSIMPWPSVYHHSMMDPAVFKYIKEVWQFQEQPILVVLDSQGKVVNNNAFHMLRIWRSLAFPFTREKEKELWEEYYWRTELLVDSVDAAMSIWVAENKYICLYGGEDIGWIRQFTATAKTVAQAARIPLEIIYVGKSNPQENIPRNISIIVEEKLSHSLEYPVQVWLFWARLESMWHSKKQHCGNVENDPVMHEINNMLDFDRSDQEWTVFCKGSNMAKANGKTILECLNDFDLWKNQVNDEDFVTALNYYNCKKSLDQIIESPHMDSMRVLRVLINAKQDQLPLLEGATSTEVSKEVLMRKHLLLLISDLNMPNEELFNLKQIYQESREHRLKTERQFEVVWLPFVDRSTQWTQAKQDKFDTLLSKMPWPCVWNHSMIGPTVLSYIKVVWQFKKSPILVVLDPQGKVVNSNAFPMLLTWRSFAFPFTSEREKALWEKEYWRIELLVKFVDASIPIWVEEDKCICFYGGEDLGWIRQFTATAKTVAQAVGISLEIIYVGKSNPQDIIRRNISTIAVEKLSHCLEDLVQVWYFWARLEGMWHSRMQHGWILENDPLMQEIQALLSFDRSDQGWAVYYRGSNIAKANGETIMESLKGFNLWKIHVSDEGFVTALSYYICKTSLDRSMKSSNMDCVTALSVLINAKEDQLPLLEGATKRRVMSKEVLMRKHVLLLISDLDMPIEELFKLKQLYQESREHPLKTESQFEVLWLPIVDRSTLWTQAMQDKFEKLQSTMPWLSLHYHSMIDPMVLAYIKVIGQFKKKPILVVLDPQGMVVNDNALYMIYIWGANAFPFTRAREEELWKDQTWRIEFLLDGIDRTIFFPMAEKTYICLLGGEEIEWIRKLTTTAKQVAQVACIPLEIIYVGKKEEACRKISTIVVEMLSKSMQYLTSIRYFWLRLESMWHSKKKLGSVENDTIMQEIETLLSFDRSDQAWAMFCSSSKGSSASAMVKTKGQTILQCLEEFNLWRTHVNDTDFLTALNDYNCKLSLTRLLESPHTDNVDVLKALICAKEDQLPLFHGLTKTRAGIEVLMRKQVLLLISDLDVSSDELFILKKMYLKSRKDPLRIESQFEIVWIPVTDGSTSLAQAKQDKLDNLQLTMPWYSMYQHSMIDTAVIMYMKEVWLFRKNPIVVVLDTQGKVVNNNALHMLRIWGSTSFPFSSDREEALWKEESWRIEVLAYNVDEAIPIWIEEDKYICLYGGEDIEWIRKFTATANAVAQDAHIPLEMLYMGKSNAQEKVRKNISTIISEKLSLSIQDLTSVWYFWERLESMRHSKKQLGRSEENDPIMKEILTLLGFDGSDQAWALFCRGSAIAIASGETILQWLRDFKVWKTRVTNMDFVTALNGYNRKLSISRLMESLHMDNTNVLKALVYSMEDQLPLLNCATNRKASIEVLQKKHVLLLISDLDVSYEELSILKKRYLQSREHPLSIESQFEFVWVPVTDESTSSTQAKQNKFDNLRFQMPWYSVYQHSMIDPAAIMYIREVWQFKKKPILVVLDPQGKVVNNDALNMLWIWGTIAFPFTRAKEGALWQEETWRIEFILDGIDTGITNSMAQNKYICLYGGEDIEWIRKFTVTATKVAHAARIPLDIIYVGKSNPQAKVRENISTIAKEKLSYSIQGTSVWYFWVRLESMWHSRKMLDRSVENDPIMQEIETLLGFDRGDQEWAIFFTCKELAMAKGKGEIILQCLEQFNLWKTHVNYKNFVTLLNDYNRKLSLAQFMESPHKNNLNVLRALLCVKEDKLPLLSGTTKTRVSIDILVRKHVLLLISDLDVSHEELFMLKQMYRELCDQHQLTGCPFEFVWLPVTDESTAWNQAKQDQYENLQSRMPWYSVYHKSMIDPAVIMYINEVWQFKKKPILVVLDPHGNVLNKNALHMLWIWGSLAFPFSNTREEALWEKESWGIKLLTDKVDAAIPTWIAEDKYICLYGGEDIEWIRKFTATADAVAQVAHIPLEMLYIGKSNPQEKVRRNISTITLEKLSHSMEDLTFVWYFWERLVSMWHSKDQLNMGVENDSIMQEIATLLIFDGFNQTWAVFCRGSSMVKAKGEAILRCLNDFNLWKTHLNHKDFLTAFQDHLKNVPSNPFKRMTLTTTRNTTIL